MRVKIMRDWYSQKSQRWSPTAYQGSPENSKQTPSVLPLEGHVLERSYLLSPFPATLHDATVQILFLSDRDQSCSWKGTLASFSLPALSSTLWNSDRINLTSLAITANCDWYSALSEKQITENKLTLQGQRHGSRRSGTNNCILIWIFYDRVLSKFMSLFI